MVETVPRAVPFENHAKTVPRTVPFQYIHIDSLSMTANTAWNMAQLTSFRTTTPSTAMTGRMTTKQVNPVHVHLDTPCKAPQGHCMCVHQPAVQVCKPGELLSLRKVKHPHNGRTSVNRLPLTKQHILSQYSSCFEGIGCFTGICTNFTSNQNTHLHTCWEY